MNTITAPPPSGEAPVAKIAPTEQQASQAGVPKKIVNAQTVCNEKNEKGKLCNGHLKQLRTGGEEAEEHLRGDDVLFKCQTCGTLYMGPPLGHVRDPRKQQRFVQKELTALLQAAGGTLPAFTKSATGAWVPAAEPAIHPPAAKPASAASAKTAATPAAKTAAPPTASEPDDETVEQKRARRIAEANARKATAIPIPGASGPVEGETPEQKIARLKAVVAEAKRRKEAAAAEGEDEVAVAPVPRTTPTAASTSGLDSSPSADAHRPAAEAQAATGQASAVPLSPAAATASPAAGAETIADLAPEASTELTPGAPKSAPPKSATSGKGIPPPPPHLAPPPGETKEEKIARLTRIVAEAKARAGK
ncbi:MAG TPA: hypothetical protein VM866_10505 [Pyrinomonadaceae bacterium]|nr:hypothetical protein [Pyrinomonadaceae bacterium]